MQIGFASGRAAGRSVGLSVGGLTTHSTKSVSLLIQLYLLPLFVCIVSGYVNQFFVAVVVVASF